MSRMVRIIIALVGALVAIGLTVFLVVIFVSPESNPQLTAPPFELVILKPSWYELGITYEADPAFATLQAADPAGALITFTLDDVEQYSAAWQMITLNEAATDRLIQSLEQLPRQSDVQALLAAEDVTGWGNPLATELYLQPFIVRTHSSFVYGGTFLDAMSQMAINYPVIRAEIVDQRAIFHILPVQIPFVEYDPVPRPLEAREAAFSAAIAPDREQDPTFFDEAVNTWANSQTANQLRTVIRDQRIVDAMSAAGKLAP